MKSFGRTLFFIEGASLYEYRHHLSLENEGCCWSRQRVHLRGNSGKNPEPLRQIWAVRNQLFIRDAPQSGVALPIADFCFTFLVSGPGLCTAYLWTLPTTFKGLTASVASPRETCSSTSGRGGPARPSHGTQASSSSLTV